MVDFCVVCGRSDRPVVEGVCADCYADRTPLLKVPERPKIVICPTCGARRVGSHWEGRGRAPGLLGAEDLAQFLEVHPEAGIRKVDWVDESRHPLQRDLKGTARLRFRGTERTQDVAFTVRIEHRTCEECSRRSGHYFTATIQLRGAEDDPREKAPALRGRLQHRWEELLNDARPEWREALSWMEERPEGLDVFLTDSVAARALARFAKGRLSATLKESATLWGRKDGHDVYRVTLCLRIPTRSPDGAEVPRRRRPAGASPPGPTPRTAAL